MLPENLKNKTCEERAEILLAELSEKDLRKIDKVLSEKRIDNILNDPAGMYVLKKLLPLLFENHVEREVVFTLKRWGLGEGFILL